MSGVGCRASGSYRAAVTRVIGLAGILVRTGKYREDFVRESGVEPTATVASISEVPGLFVR